jgi:hypothetical protein
VDYTSVRWVFDLRITSSVFHLTILRIRTAGSGLLKIIKIKGDSLDPVNSRPLKDQQFA